MAEQKNRSGENLNWKQSIILYMHDVMIYLTVIVVLFLLVFRVVVVSGTSMNMTLLDGDYLLLLCSHFDRSHETGDVVVISKNSFDDGKPIVKRVIATEGQTVEIDFEAGVVYVDGSALQEDYTFTPTNTTGGLQFPLTVADGCVFVLGDNRNGSRDSRYPEIGLVDQREILGRAIFLFLPGTNGTDFNGNPKQNRDFGRIGVIN